MATPSHKGRLSVRAIAAATVIGLFSVPVLYWIEPILHRAAGSVEHHQVGVTLIGALGVATLTMAFLLRRGRRHHELRQREAAIALCHRLDSERLITELSGRFLHQPPEQIDQATDEALRDIGKFAGADRCYLFTVRPDGETIDNTHEWVRPGIRPFRDDLQGVPLSQFNWLMPRLAADHPVAVDRVDALPPEADVERAEFERQNIQSLLMLPTVDEGRLLGFIGLDAVGKPKHWCEKDIDMLRTAGDIVMAARHQAEGQRELRESRHHLEQLIENLPVAVFAKDADGRFITWNHLAEELFGLATEEVLGKTDFDLFPAEQAEFFQSKDREILRTGLPTEIPEEPVDTPRLGRRWLCTVKVPMTDSDGARAFILAISEDITSRREVEKQLADANAKLAARAGELEEHNREVRVLAEGGQRLQACAKPTDACIALGRAAEELFPASSGALFLVGEDPQQPMPRAYAWGRPADHVHEVCPSNCRAICSGRSQIMGAVCGGKTCPNIKACGRSVLCIPVRAYGQLMGVVHMQLDLENQEAAHYAARMAEALADRFGLSLANLRLRETLRRQTVRDPLTDLFNRRYLEASLERELTRAARENEPLALLMIDLDHFKHFNDEHGHPAGDRLLIAVARMLRDSVRGSDVVCRYGGEEFTILMPGATLLSAMAKARRLLSAVHALRIRRGRDEIHGVTLSIGVAVAPDHGTSADRLVQAADKALYSAKAAGRDCVRSAETAAACQSAGD